MVTLPPQPDIYRLPSPHDSYRGHPSDPYRGQPQHMNFNQPAPRQRTAIACRYCRRRKIRCSGFESSEDGRCTNCQRFQQECMFTPVSSQAQAFVPAHTAYPHLRNQGGSGQSINVRGRALYPQNPVIYGAHGQPLGPLPQQQDHYSPQHLQQQGYPLPSPSASYQGSVSDDRGPHDHINRRRPHDEPHAPTLPPPLPGTSSSQQPGRRGSSGASDNYQYPDPTSLTLQPVSPASSATSYQSAYSSAQTATQQQPYYPSQAARRSSPQSAYSYDNRTSASPHAGSQSSGSGYPFPGLHPPQVLPPSREARTPPPPVSQQQQQSQQSGSGNRAGMSIRDMLGEGGTGQGGRSTTDSDMLKALNRRPM
ncbi:MAG: hypothetical protein M1827_001134 [Pycnora praestabilis]|nr:MAG: hypothetical protein M1827_001134 [Pycnora praestabilis]